MNYGPKRKPSLNHFQVWSFPSELHLYNPSKGKIQSKSTHCSFVGYQGHSKGNKFNYSEGVSKIVESKNQNF